MRETAVRSWHLAGFLGALIVLVLPGTALAQTDLGQISGKVLDPKEAVVIDAKVTVTNLATSAKQTTATNGEGLFTIGNVRVGEYEIAVEKDIARHRVEIHVGKSRLQDLGTAANRIKIEFPSALCADERATGGFHNDVARHLL